MNGAGRARGTVAEIVKHGRRGLDLRPVIEFVASGGERVVFEDEMGVGKYDHGRQFEIAYDPADPWGTAVAVRTGRWFWSSVVGWLVCTAFLIAGIVLLVHGIIGHKRG